MYQNLNLGQSVYSYNGIILPAWTFFFSLRIVGDISKKRDHIEISFIGKISTSCPSTKRFSMTNRWTKWPRRMGLANGPLQTKNKHLQRIYNMYKR